MLTMRAYGQTSDANSGLLRDSWGCGAATTGAEVGSHEEFGWKEPDQRTTEFAPSVKGKPFTPAVRSVALTGLGLTPRKAV